MIVWIATMLAIVIGCALLEIAIIRWTNAVSTEPRPWTAARHSFAIRVATSVIAVLFIADHGVIIAAALGDALGSWIETERRRRAIVRSCLAARDLPIE